MKAAYGSENPSVMVVDVGAMNDRVRRGLGGQGSEQGGGLGQGLGQEQHFELPLLPPSPPMTSSITASQLPLPTPPSLPTLPPTTITTALHLHTNDPPVSWGVGDRTGMFLLVLRSLALLQRIPITTKYMQQPTNPLSSAQGQGLETSLEEVTLLHNYEYITFYI